VNGEPLFLTVFLILFLAGSIIRGYYARKMPSRERSLKQRLQEMAKTEGKLIATLLILQSIILMVALILYLWSFFGLQLPWAQLPLPEWLRWIGAGLGAFSLPLLLWVHHTLGRHWTVALEIQEEHTLITTGPYSRIRHPMYTAHILLFLSWSLVTANLLFLANWIVTLIVIFTRMPKEERMDTYQAYMQRTGRLLPRLRRRKEDKET